MDSKSPKGGFALLIGKGKDKGAPMSPSEDETAADLGMDEGMDQSGAENSAVKDMMSALSSKDVQSFKAALQDFLQICYPQLSDQDKPTDSGSDESGSDESGSDESDSY